MKDEMGFTNKWIKKVETLVVGSLNQLSSKIKEGLKKKLALLRKQKVAKQQSKVKDQRKLDTKVVYNNSSKKLTEGQLELLSLGLNFGVTPKTFPLLQYVTAAEVLCKKLEDIGDADSMEKATYVRNEVFI